MDPYYLRGDEEFEMGDRLVWLEYLADDRLLRLHVLLEDGSKRERVNMDRNGARELAAGLLRWADGMG